MDAFFQPAFAALVPQVVPADDLPSANSLTSLSLNLGRVGGPAVGALLVGRVGSAWGFGLLPIGLAAAGWATEAFGAPVVFILGGGITAAVSLLALAHPAIRKLD